MKRLVVMLAAALAFGCSKADRPEAPQNDLFSGKAPQAQTTPRLDTAALKRYMVAEHFKTRPTTYVRSLHVDGNELYVGTSTGVLVVDRHSGDMQRTFARLDGMRNQYAFVVRKGRGDSVWMGTNAGGLSVFQNGTLKNYLPKHGLADIWVYDIAFQGDDTTWLGTWDGVNRIVGDMDNKANWTTYNTEDGLVNPWVYAIQIDRHGAAWFGTEGGLSRLDNGQWTTWLHKDGMGAPNPYKLASSPKSGFGSVGKGRSGKHSHDLTLLSTLDDSGAETYNKNYIFALLFDHQGNLWIGTWGGGVARFNGKSFVNYNQEDGLAGNVVYSIAQAPDGAMWFGTNHGISRFDGKNWHTYQQSDGLLGEDVYTLAIDADHTVWAGQKGGVTKLTLAPPHGPHGGQRDTGS